MECICSNYGVLEAAELSHGASPCLSATAKPSDICSEPNAFSRLVAHLMLLQQFYAILADGSVVTLGSPDHGGDSSQVQDQLKNVQKISGTSAAFAAILGDGSVVTWGQPARGGDSSRVQDLFRYS
jgi:hypothetical protein